MYDEQGNITQVKKAEAPKSYSEDKEELTHTKNPDGSEYWYNKNGKIIHSNSNGFEIWYGENGELVHTKKPDGSEWWKNKEKDE